MGLLDGLIMGFTQGLQQHSATKQANDARQIQMEHDALATLAQSSDNPEIQSAAIAGLLELAQGKRKSGGILGIGKLTQLPAFAKINEIAQRMRGSKGGAAPSGPGPTPPSSVPTDPSVNASSLESGGGEGGQPDIANLLNGLVGGMSQGPSSGGEVSAPDVATPPPAAPMSAALPSTNLTQSAPNAGGAAAPPLVTPPPTPVAPPISTPPPGPHGIAYPEVPRSDYGTLGPTGGAQIQGLIKGEETEKDRARYDAQLKLEVERAKQKEKLQEDRQRQADRAREDQQAAAADLQRVRDEASERRAANREAGLEARLNNREIQRDKEAEKKEQAALTKARQAALARIDLLTAFPEDHPQHLSQQAAIQAKQGIWTEYPPGADEEAPRFMGLPGGTTAMAGGYAKVRNAPPPPPSPSGPPGPPPDYSQVPNWPKIKSTVEAQKRSKKSPQEILAMASSAGLLPIQLQALKSYLRIP